MSDLILPPVQSSTVATVNEVINSLGVSREIVASDEEIEYAWRDLPRELRSIPEETRNEKLGALLARMCIAVSVGLFDAAINYAWNAAVLQLQDRVRQFGLNVVSQILDRRFEEADLRDLRDSELLSLCLELNLISEDGSFFLEQCRDTRNNFSAAHPSIGVVNDREFTAFLNRCVRYALSLTSNPRGIDFKAFIQSVKGARFSEDQLSTWMQRIRDTHDAQRELVFESLHGIYCDPASSEEFRVNSLSICQAYVSELTPSIKSSFVDQHYDYKAKGDQSRSIASQNFFERLGLFNLLTDQERHSIISSACKKLLSVHKAFDNFHNEPPFAQRLREITSAGILPESAQDEYVTTVLTCFVGNEYGISNKAVGYYRDMIIGFSPREISIMLKAPTQHSNLLSKRISTFPRCRKRFQASVSLLSPESIPSSLLNEYQRWAS